MSEPPHKATLHGKYLTHYVSSNDWMIPMKVFMEYGRSIKNNERTLLAFYSTLFDATNALLIRLLTESWYKCIEKKKIMYQWYKKLLPYHGKEKSLAIFNSGVNQQKNNFFGFLYVSTTG